MEKHDPRASGEARSAMVRQSLEYLRQRSLHRVWWNSARVALRRGHSGDPPPLPMPKAAADRAFERELSKIAQRGKRPAE